MNFHYSSFISKLFGLVWSGISGYDFACSITKNDDGFPLYEVVISTSSSTATFGGYTVPFLPPFFPFPFFFGLSSSSSKSGNCSKVFATFPPGTNSLISPAALNPPEVMLTGT